MIANTGSVMIEHLVAIALLGLLVAGAFSLLITGSLAAQLAQRTSLADGLAAQKLEEVAATCDGPAELPREPVDARRFPGYQWRAGVTEVAPGLCEVTVTVWWPVRGRERSLSLATLARRQEAP